MSCKKDGFTFTEMLTVVAILAVLTAAAIPAIITVRGNLKMRELDDTAREIFLAAQNSLTARKAANVSLELGEKDGNGCCWLSSSPGSRTALLSTGAIEGVAAGNHYMIWYSPSSATVLEVYYAEDGLPAEEIKEGTYSDHDSASGKEARREAWIGYYNGSDLDWGKAEPLVPPRLNIENADELTVVITVPQDKAAEYAAAGVTLTVTVDELDQNGNMVSGKRHVFPDTGIKTDYSPVTGELKLTLDRLTGGTRFRDVCPEITPGAGIRVTATLSGPADGTKTYLPASAHADTNSLFARRAVVGGRDTLYIACARHLQNLEPSVSKLPDPPAETPNYCAEQTKEIQWPGGQFQPIGNRSLRAYNGNGNEIADLWVNCDKSGTLSGDSGAGLFAFVENAVLSNIRLADPVLTGSNAKYAGALAGILQKSTVSNCQVYAAGDAAGINCAGYAVGGLVGLAADNYVVTGSSASLPRVRSTARYIGGLIGIASVQSGFSNGLVSECYADTGWMGNDKKWDSKYGMLGSAPACIGGLTGRAQGVGTHSVENCYALGWFSGGSGGSLVGEIYGVTLISTSYSILQSGDGNHYYASEGTFNSLSQLEELHWPGWSTGGATTAYHPDICTGSYPYPRLSLHHYGDWPVQTVDGIRLFDGNAAGSNELCCLIVPTGVETAEFYAQAQEGERPAMQEVTVAQKDAPRIADAQTEYDTATGRTKVTLTFPKDNTPCVTYVDLNADGHTLRTVVVRYSAAVTLTGKNTVDNTTGTGSASSDGNSEIGTLKLSSNAKTGTFTAEIAVVPGREQIAEAVQNWRAGASGQFKVSYAEEDFHNWEMLYSPDPEDPAARDPAVTANGNPDAGSNILAPVEGSYYPAAGDGGELEVTGAASGTATVSARWAVDESLKADCEVKMEGARVLIETATARGEDGRELGTKGNYPYRLDLTAKPKEAITLTFTPKLFGGQGGSNGEYTWQIKGTSGTAFSSGPEKSQNENGVWDYTLPDISPRAAYTVTLTYTNDSGEKSVDYMTFSVYRAASRGTSGQGTIRLYQWNTTQEISGREAGQVEQIEAVWDNQRVDQVTLEGYVAGAGNTRVRWLVKPRPDTDPDDPASWEPVTGVVGSQTVQDADGKARAAVEWVSGNKTLSTDGSITTGGAIRVTGLDANEYGEVFEVRLKAEAMEAVGTGEAPSKTVTVRVMPKLEIIPQVKTIISYVGLFELWKPHYTFDVNRTDQSWVYTWKRDGEELSSSKDAIRQEVIAKSNDHVTVSCEYGPFTATATYTWLGYLEELTASINADCTIDDKEYFILDKGKTRNLEFSWGNSLHYNIRNEPAGTYDSVGLAASGGERNAERVGPAQYVGSRTYNVVGNKFTRDNVETLPWTFERTNDPFHWYDKTRYKYFAVVGMEINEPSGIDKDHHGNFLLEKGQSVQLTTTTSFAGELRERDSLTWESDHKGLVAVDENGVITALKNGAATYAATITATYTVECKNGKNYTFKDYITVKVQPKGTMDVELQPCTKEDVTALNAVFGDGLTRDSVLVPVDGGGSWTLVQGGGFGLDTMYLKAAATLDGVPLSGLDDYIGSVSGDAFYLDMEAGGMGGTLYIRVKAKEASTEVTDVDLTAEIGTASDTQTVRIYGAPTVKLMRENGTKEDVTNGSIPVYLDDGLNVTLRAELMPTLYSYEDNNREDPLDAIVWQLQAPTGYDPGRYLSMEVDGNTIKVWLKSDRMPDFRVVLRGRSAKGGEDSGADAGYALVFLPVEREQP